MTGVLLLNNNYEPLNVCTVVRAVSLMSKGKAEVLHNNGHMVVTGHSSFHAPSVLRLRYFVKRPLPQLRLSRHTVLARDNYTCQYCGVTGKDLTLDHVVPRRQGGRHTWENVVACCRRCNLRKADKLAHQANMKLKREPRRPRYVPYISLTSYLRAQSREEWLQYLPAFDFTGPLD
ncbi:MAG TPA: HNH endonuclease [Fimbriimonadales bacterium]|jgi:5-methylcytosine-specific restriction endonuclease McrA|nr:HNH endonuclease [Fimbriimonadales bacterium]